eukprot:SAG22_NODE_1_length_62449_cov_158.689270_7_plen_347_part_00
MFRGDGCEPAHPLNGTGPFGQDRYLCMKASTDRGQSWGALQKNLTAGRASNPSALHDAVSEHIIVQYDNPVDYPISHADYPVSGGIWQVVSKDGGVSWGAPCNLTAAGGLPAGQYHLGSAGAGAQISFGPHKGRLLFTGYTHLPLPNNSLHARVWYSDDSGGSWKSSPQVLPHMGEPQMSELVLAGGGGQTQRSSSLAIVARNNNHVGCRCRLVSTSEDGGVSWSEPVPVPSLPDPACEGPIAPDPRRRPQGGGGGGGGGGGLLSAGPKATGRFGLGIYASPAGNNLTGLWRAVAAVGGPAQGAAYSSMAVIGGDTVGVLRETGADGCVGPSCAIVFTATTLPPLR